MVLYLPTFFLFIFSFYFSEGQEEPPLACSCVKGKEFCCYYEDKPHCCQTGTTCCKSTNFWGEHHITCCKSNEQDLQPSILFYLKDVPFKRDMIRTWHKVVSFGVVVVGLVLLWYLCIKCVDANNERHRIISHNPSSPNFPFFASFFSYFFPSTVPEVELSPSTSTPELEKQIKESLKRVRYGKDTAAELCNKCSICLLDYLYNDHVVVLPCSHSFHSSCVVQWLATHKLCPLCRQLLVLRESKHN